MKEIARFYDAEEAQIAAGYLRAQGFDVQLGDENMLGLEPHLRIALGGYRLMAPQNEAHMATVALNEVRGAPETRAHLEGYRCGNCGGATLRRMRNPLLAFLHLPLGWLFPFSRATKNLRCTACGHTQPAEPDEEPA